MWGCTAIGERWRNLRLDLAFTTDGHHYYYYYCYYYHFYQSLQLLLQLLHNNNNTPHHTRLSGSKKSFTPDSRFSLAPIPVDAGVDPPAKTSSGSGAKKSSSFNPPKSLPSSSESEESTSRCNCGNNSEEGVFVFLPPHHCNPEAISF